MNFTILQKKSIDFIKRDLIPEMVFDRCFCDRNSREFVELETVELEPVDQISRSIRSCEIYRVKVVLRFSGEPHTFALLVKLLSNVNDNSQMAFEAFQNEEMFYNKMTLKYGTDYVPKCYLADLGRYGRPVIVLEDLEASGYLKMPNELDENHLRFCVKLLGNFHGNGLKLKADKFPIFREFYAKFLDVTLPDEESLRHRGAKLCRVLNVLNILPTMKVTETLKRMLAQEDPFQLSKNIASDTEVDDVSTICHGHFSPDNLLFKYQEEKPIDVKVIDWQTMRYSSPAIDLGLISFDSLVREGTRRPFMLQEIWKLYVDTVKIKFPEIDEKRFRDDVLDKFLLACLLLSLDKENLTDEELQEIIRQFQSLN